MPDFDLSVPPDGERFGAPVKGIHFSHEQVGKHHVVTLFHRGEEVTVCRIEPKIEQPDQDAIDHAKAVLLHYWYMKTSDDWEETGTHRFHKKNA